jgi:hypothetical protein
MSIKEKIRQSLNTLSEQDLAKVEQLIEELKNKQATQPSSARRRTQHLKTYDLGGKYDQVNIRDVAYE